MRTFEVGDRVRITKNSAGIRNPEYLAVLGKETAVTHVDRACSSPYRTEERLRWDWEQLQKIKQPKKRWRAEKCGTYFYVTRAGEVASWSDMRTYFDDGLYEVGNYFRTYEEARAAAAKVLAVFTSHKES